MRLFLNYRRQDGVGFAGRLADSLEAALGDGSVSRYVEEQEAEGASDRSVAQQLKAIDAVVVMIGPHWLDTGEGGQPLLEGEDDFVRLQLEAALSADRTIVIALVGGAALPDRADLPDSLAELVRCESFALSDATWAADVEHLVGRLRPSLPVVTTAAAPLAPQPSSTWVMTGGLVAVVFLLGAFLLTSRFWLDAPPVIVGAWVAELSYDEGRTYQERFEFRLTGRELTGSASYQGVRRVIESGHLDADRVEFLLRTRERRGHEQLELRHRYTGVVSSGRIDFTLETAGDTLDRSPIEFAARPAGN